MINENFRFKIKEQGPILLVIIQEYIYENTQI